MRKTMDDPHFPDITYRSATSGRPTPVLRGTRIRVQTLVVESQQRHLSAERLAEKYHLTYAQVQEALDFYAAHRHDIDAAIQTEQQAKQKPV